MWRRKSNDPGCVIMFLSLHVSPMHQAVRRDDIRHPDEVDMIIRPQLRHSGSVYIDRATNTAMSTDALDI